VANFISGQVCNGQIWALPVKATLALQCNIKKLLDPSQECPPLPSLSDLIAPPAGESRDIMANIQAGLAKGTATCQAQTAQISALTKTYICDINGSITLSVNNAKALTCKIQQLFQTDLTCPELTILPADGGAASRMEEDSI